MKKPLFSIIVPTHNGETYIRKCLDSIKSQTIKDYELIVVCDACEDNTEQIAREYTDKVLTVNYERDGLTRNVGLDIACGKWVMFLDDDDWWTDKKVLTQVKATLNEDTDIAFYSFYWQNNGYHRQNENVRYVAVWNKCWRRSFIGDTRFTDTKFWSDAEFHKEMMAKNPRCAYFDIPIYYYNFMREGSINHRASKGEK